MLTHQEENEEDNENEGNTEFVSTFVLDSGASSHMSNF